MTLTERRHPAGWPGGILPPQASAAGSRRASRLEGGAPVVFLLALLLTACSSGSAKDELNLPPPPASDYPSPQQQPATDARLNELPTSMTELLERLDVMNDRLAKMEAARADLSSTSERRVRE